MKELFLLLSLCLPMTEGAWHIEDYQTLWSQVRQAEQDGKPQQAVSLLTTLDTIALNNCDTLEHLEVLDRICRNVKQYNWKEAGKWESLYNEIWNAVSGDLDHYIETYHDHPRVARLILAKIEQLKGAEDCLEVHTPDGYANVRRMCALAQELFPESEQCAAFKDIIRQMDSRELYVKSADETLYPGESVEFVLESRNNDSVRMEVFRTGDGCRLMLKDQPFSLPDDKTEKIADEEITSFACEYNVYHDISRSFTFETPGIYLVRFSAEGIEMWSRIYVSRVAVALRGSGASKQIYVADGRTGKPFPKADVQIFKDDDTETIQYDSSALLSQKSYRLNGFTDLRQQLFPRDNRFSNLAVAVGEDVWSAPVHLWKESGPGRRVESETHYIYTDRKLYRPADTIEFKLIAVKSDGSAGKVLAGQKVNVELRNASQKDAVGVLSLETNPMGSAVGRFVIPEDAKLGRWWISSRCGSSNFRIEEYKDPGFSVKLSNVEGPYGFDREIVQKGTVASYTGVPVADAEVSYKISQIKVWGQSNGLEEIKGVVLTDNSGGFEIPFVVPAPDDGKTGTIMATVEVTVTASSGETRQQSKYLQISRQRLNMAIEFLNGYTDKSFSIVDKGKEHSFTTTVRNNDGASLPVRGSWRLISKGKNVASGEYAAEEPVSIDFSKLSGGGYQLECKATADGYTLCDTLDLAVFSPDDKRPPVPCETFFYPVKDKDAIDFVIGSSSELYAEVELFDNGKVVERRAVHVENALERISLPYKSSYRDEVVVSVFGFRNMERIELSHRFGRTVPSHNFDLKVSSLRDFTTPATTETFTVEAPSSELMVSVYDVTSDRYGANRFAFNPIRKYYASKPYVSTNIGPSFKIRGLGYTKSAGKVAAAMPNTFGAVEEAGFFSDSFASPADMSDRETASLEAETDEPEDVMVREDFGQTLAFLPQIEVREGIPSEIKFTTRDGLSTFRVLMLAHTADLRSGSASHEIVVRREVMVMPQLPLFATVGDRIVIKAPVSNQTESQIRGVARLVLTDAESGKELDLGTKEVALTISAGSSANAEWEVVVPQVGRLGVEVRYVAEGFSDAEKRIVKIVPSVKTLTAARSFIIGGGVTKEDCIAELQSKFNAPAAEIRYEEYSSLSALKEVLTPPALPKGGDMIAWLDAFYVNQMRGYLLGQEALDVKVMNKAIARLSSLQKGDGGWGWFPCCESSDMLTMLFLERVYHVRKTGTLPLEETLSLQVARAVGFVDARIVEMSAQKDWSVRQMGELLSVRTLYPQCPMSPNVKQALAAYLDKTRNGWQQMPVLAKAHHCRVLASAGEKERLSKVVASLKDYAVKNNTVGCYFPNAVMPWRGLMHTEIYAHSLLVEVFDMVGEKEMVKGLTQWLLLQKHNQQWGSVGASSDAVYALVSHSREDLRFGAVYYTYTTPMIDALPDASGISVSREYYLDGKKLEDGDVLRPGNRVDAVYKVCSDENRSFVEMTAMRPACFYPTDERSYGSWGWYCEKEASQTKFYFQLLPEETTELRESFFVVQEGVFNSGLVEIFSKYAPEYRGHTGAAQVVSRR